MRPACWILYCSDEQSNNYCLKGHFLVSRGSFISLKWLFCLVNVTCFQKRTGTETVDYSLVYAIDFWWLNFGLNQSSNGFMFKWCVIRRIAFLFFFPSSSFSSSSLCSTVPLNYTIVCCHSGFSVLIWLLNRYVLKWLYLQMVLNTDGKHCYELSFMLS